MAEELHWLSIGELAKRLESHEVSPVELVECCLERIEAHDPELNSFITVAHERARAAARRAEADILSGNRIGPLHGIPIAVKDIVDVAGMPTTCGSKALADNVPDTNASVIDHLEGAGAIILGKLNMNEFATLLPSEHFGAAVNPWSADHSPGGSSSGSGSAVAAGLCPAALGTDTGGSIRIPAAFGGVAGLKATHGRVSNFGVTPLAWSLDHIGPLARSVADTAHILNATAGYDAQDLSSRACEVPDFCAELDTGVAGLRLARPTAFFPELTDPEVQAAFDAAVDVLVDLGARVEPVALPGLEQAWDIADAIIAAEGSTWHARLLEERGADYGPKVRTFLSRGRDAPASAYVEALRAREAFRRDMLSALSPFDALLTPGTLIPPPPLGARSVTIGGEEVSLRAAIVSATAPFNLTGQPALTVPCGLSSTGLPLALQIVARPFDETRALRVGHAYEAATPWHRSHPAGF